MRVLLCVLALITLLPALALASQWTLAQRDSMWIMLAIDDRGYDWDRKFQLACTRDKIVLEVTQHNGRVAPLYHHTLEYQLDGGEWAEMPLSTQLEAFNIILADSWDDMPPAVLTWLLDIAQAKQRFAFRQYDEHGNAFNAELDMTGNKGKYITDAIAECSAFMQVRNPLAPSANAGK